LAARNLLSLCRVHIHIRQRTLVERLRKGLTLAVLDDLYAGHFVEPSDHGFSRKLCSSSSPPLAQGVVRFEFLSPADFLVRVAPRR